uniref:DEP domain-containing protein n=1 Tax=Davidia involucrata TaxID=16924 RepID=A0A5B7BTD1_DAVIN
MDVSKQGENGNVYSTAGDGRITHAHADGERPGKGGLNVQNGERIQLENGEEFSGENARKGEKILNGNLVPDEEEISIRYASENISNSVDSSQDSNCSLNENGDKMATSEFSEIVLEKGEVNVEEERDNEPPMTGKQDEIQINPPENDVSGEDIAVISKTNGDVVQIIRPHSQLPKPEAPRGIMNSSPLEDENSHQVQRSRSLPEKASVDMPSIGKFIREKSNSFSAAIAKRLSSLKERENEDSKPYSNVTEFNLSGLKVTVKFKNNGNDDIDNGKKFVLKGRISFFTRSNCRDCSAVRSFFRERGLRFVEINIDVYPMREKELIERTGSSSVPQIFFNEKLFGGLVALNSLRNCGMFEQRLKEMLERKCPDDAPAPPVYGFDDPEEEHTDQMVGIIRVLRQRLPIQDRLMKMKIVKNCFAGSEMVEVIIQHLDCGRKKAIEVGKQLARKHFIHHVFGENEFEDGNHFYRFLEHEPFIPKCFNFRGSINDSEPKSAAMVSQRLAKIMSAILESYASEDRRHLDYLGISNSEEFRRYVNLAQDLHRVNILALSADEKMTLFLNLHNAMVIHAVIRIGHPGGVVDRKVFYSDFQYLVGGHPYSLTTIKNGILRSNRRPPYSLVKPFGAGDKRLELAFPKVNPLIHFGLCNGTRSSPTVRFYTSQGVEAELRRATREFFQSDGMEVDLAKRTVYLSGVIKWFSADFGQEKEILKWVLNYLDATKSGLLTHLLGDGGPINIVYKNYDWAVNS